MDMPEAMDRIPFSLLEEAAEWFAMLHSTAVSEQDKAAWQQWLDKSEQHRNAWQSVQAVSSRFAAFAPQQTAAMQALDAASRQSNGRRQAMKTLLVMAAVGTSAWLGAEISPVRRGWLAIVADHSTQVGEQKALVLADGTQVWLNTATALDAGYDAALRRLYLRDGEILIESAHDVQTPSRPLVVDTNQGRLRALGTRFTVRQLDGETVLSVFSGAVEIAPRHGTIAVIEAGQQARFDRTKIILRQAADPANEGWASGVLLADNMPLATFLDELGRYRSGYFGCDPQIADLRVVGAYPVQDIPRTLSMLESVLPVRVSSPMPWWTSISAAQ
jgi:transmembrane sensor